MTLHLIKLCVGVGTLPELAAWQARRLQDARRVQEKPELFHVTRNTPRRGAEIIQGGSLYWVIKGLIVARQRLLEFRRVDKDGVPHCALVLDAELVAVEPRVRRPFQGWRYLPDQDAPPDMSRGTDDADLPSALRRELISLGLL